MQNVTRLLVVAAIVLVYVPGTQALVMETVPVGNPGNAGELSGGAGGYGPARICGAVGYAYSIGTYEVTAGQYREFLNAVAASDPYGLYSPSMDSNSYGCQITRHGTDGNYTYDFSGGTVEAPGSTASDWASRPVNWVSWGDAARFCNWLTNGQGSGDTENGLYDLAGTHSYYNPDGSINDYPGLNAALLAVIRKNGLGYAIPTEDEWYKAAYHKNDGVTSNYFDYPTSSNSKPSNALDGGGNNATFFDNDWTIGSPYCRTNVGTHVNSDSLYGTFDQGGNVMEWNEEVHLGMIRGTRGGAFGYDYTNLLASDRRTYVPVDGGEG